MVSFNDSACKPSSNITVEEGGSIDFYVQLSSGTGVFAFFFPDEEFEIYDDRVSNSSYVNNFVPSASQKVQCGVWAVGTDIRSKTSVSGAQDVFTWNITVQAPVIVEEPIVFVSKTPEQTIYRNVGDTVIFNATTNVSCQFEYYVDGVLVSRRYDLSTLNMGWTFNEEKAYVVKVLCINSVSSKSFTWAVHVTKLVVPVQLLNAYPSKDQSVYVGKQIDLGAATNVACKHEYFVNSISKYIVNNVGGSIFNCIFESAGNFVVKVVCSNSANSVSSEWNINVSYDPNVAVVTFKYPEQYDVPMITGQPINFHVKTNIAGWHQWTRDEFILDIQANTTESIVPVQFNEAGVHIIHMSSLSYPNDADAEWKVIVTDPIDPCFLIVETKLPPVSDFEINKGEEQFFKIFTNKECKLKLIQTSPTYAEYLMTNGSNDNGYYWGETSLVFNDVGIYQIGYKIESLNSSCTAYNKIESFWVITVVDNSTPTDPNNPTDPVNTSSGNFIGIIVPCAVGFMLIKKMTKK